MKTMRLPEFKRLLQEELDRDGDGELYTERVHAEGQADVVLVNGRRSIVFEGMRVMLPEELPGERIAVVEVWPEFDSFKCEPYWVLNSGEERWVTREGWKKVNED